VYDAPEADRRISATLAAAEALWLLVLPDSVRRFVRAIYSFFEGSGGEAYRHSSFQQLTDSAERFRSADPRRPTASSRCRLCWAAL